MNKVVLIGNLTADVEKSTTANGISVSRFSLAVSRKTREETDYFNIVCWRNLADICANNLKKGKKVCVVGSIQTRKYTANDGTNRTAVEIIAEDVEFLTPRDQNAGQQNGSVSQEAPKLEETTSDGNLPF